MKILITILIFYGLGSLVAFFGAVNDFGMDGWEAASWIFLWPIKLAIRSFKLLLWTIKYEITNFKDE